MNLSPGGIALFILLLAVGVAVGCIGTVIYMRNKPGTQKGEANMETIFGHVTDLVQPFLDQLAAQHSLVRDLLTRLGEKPPASDIAAATAALALANGAGAAGTTAAAAPALASTDLTPIQWAFETKAVPSGELIAFAAFAQTCPATLTYADVLTAYKAIKGVTAPSKADATA